MQNCSVVDFHIFLLTLLQQYLNILYVSMQRHHALGFTSENGLQATQILLRRHSLMATKKKAAKKKKKK